MWVIRTFLLAFTFYAAAKNLSGLCRLYCCSQEDDFMFVFERKFKKDLKKHHKKEEEEREKLRKEYEKAQ